MIIRKLPWAGIKLEYGDNSVVIDPFYHFPSDLGTPKGSLYSLDEFGKADAVLITHVHPDHYDPEAIKQTYGAEIPIYVPNEALAFVREQGFTAAVGVSLRDAFTIESLSVAPTYSVDGIGDPQVAWIVSAGGRTIIHCGDTLWHGYWWKIKQEHGPFDAAFLPVNGPLVEFPHLQPPSRQPIVMSPEQAVSAAMVLEATYMVPIHYELVNNPPIYSPARDIKERVDQSAQEHHVTVKWLDAKETLTL